MLERGAILVLSMVVIGGLFAQPTLAAEYPTKPIEVVVPFTPGGTNDLLTRLVAEVGKKS